MMYLRNYKTDKQKRSHIERWWKKEDLFNLIAAYTRDCDEDMDIWHDIEQNCKTRKALLDKYLELCWEIVCEEYSYC